MRFQKSPGIWPEIHPLFPLSKPFKAPVDPSQLKEPCLSTPQGKLSLSMQLLFVQSTWYPAHWGVNMASSFIPRSLPSPKSRTHFHIGSVSAKDMRVEGTVVCQASLCIGLPPYTIRPHTSTAPT